MAQRSVPAFALSALLVAPCISAEAQQAKGIPRIGVIVTSAMPADPFREGLHDLGYIEGKNILIEYRNAEGSLERIPGLVDELVQQKVDVIVAPNNVAILSAKKETQAIPVVMVSSVDPVVAGYVDNLAHPGGNITGLAPLTRELSAKRLELLKEIVPKMSRAAILWDAGGPGPRVAFKEYEAAARAFKLDLQSVEVRAPNPDFPGAIRAAKNKRADALIIVGNPLIRFHLKQIMELVAKNRLPSLTDDSRYVDAGGLVSYGSNIPDMLRRAATYVDKILKGAKPADLPVEQPTKFEFIINLKTAKQIGLTIPPNVLARADRVIK
jgi:putative ABC transport system substrate-binding protein